MLAPRIAEQSTDIRGLILMAAPTRPLEELMLNQTIFLSELDGEISDEEQTQIDTIQAQMTKIQTLNFSDGEIILGAGLAYWEDLATYDPITSAEQFIYPILLLQGKRDYQVTYEDDFTAWQEAFSSTPLVTFQTYDSLNHLFLEGSGPPTNVEYNIPGNIPEQVIDDIVAWVNVE